MGTKLHELLAVIDDRKSHAKAIQDETIHTLKERNDLFLEHERRLDLFEETEMETPVERHAMGGTVPEKLKYMANATIGLYDTLLTMETTNQTAKADLTINGETLATDLPGTFLLNMEKRLHTVRQVLLHTPTLPSGKVWELDEQKGQYVYKSRDPEKSYKTEKDFAYKVLVEATKEHPAQIEKWNDTKEVGMYTREIWCSMISSADKSAMLSRVDELIREVKKARQRANNVEVVQAKIGKKLFEHILKDVV